jgi:hypothetical protein
MAFFLAFKPCTVGTIKKSTTNWKDIWMPYDPRANIYRFERVHISKDGEVLAVFKNPVEDIQEAADEAYLVRWLGFTQAHNSLMPPDLKFNSATQMREIEKGLLGVQSRKIELSIPLCTAPFIQRTLPSNVSELPTLSLP